MSNVKERILGAVTIMSEKDAEKVWNLIQAAFLLNNVDEVTPDPEEIAALNAYHSGDPDYQPAMSQEEVLKELGLQQITTWEGGVHLTYDQLLESGSKRSISLHS